MPFISFIIQNARWLAAGVLITFSTSYGQTYFISLFAGEIRAEFDLTHGDWGGIYTIGTSVSALIMLWSGTLADRFRVRVLASVMLVGLALACVTMAFNTSAALLIGVIFALRFCGQGMLGLVAMVAMARWFVAARGKALAVAGFGFMLGQGILPVLFVALMASYYWRSLWIVAAAMAIAVIPVLLLLLRVERTPQSVASENHATGLFDKHWTRPQVLKHWLFWLCLPCVIAPGTFGTALFFQQVHLTETKGWDLVGFVALVPMFTLVTGVFMLIGGWAVDRWGTRRLMPIYQIPFALAFVVFSYGDTLGWAAVAFVLFGMMQGTGTAIVGAFWAEHYGTRHLGSIKALATSVMVFGSAIGPGITGYLIDAGIIFEDQMVAISIFILFGCALAGFAIRRVHSGSAGTA